MVLQLVLAQFRVQGVEVVVLQQSALELVAQVVLVVFQQVLLKPVL